MVYGYARVSTRGQARDGNSLEAQEQELRANGAEIIYKDAYTGATSERPEFKKLLSELKEGDTLIVSKIDRFARNAGDAITIINKLVNDKIKVHVLNMGIADNTAPGRLMITILSGFAEFERDLIIERTQAGKEIARQNPNYREGRPKKFPQVVIDSALQALETKTYRQVCDEYRISKSTLVRAKREKLKQELLKEDEKSL